MRRRWVLVQYAFQNLSKRENNKDHPSYNEGLETLLKNGEDQGRDDNFMLNVTLECVMVLMGLKYRNQGTATEQIIEHTSITIEYQFSVYIAAKYEFSWLEREE